jgi:dTDP-4-amino-4,6-dideoxygalactose transaminase
MPLHQQEVYAGQDLDKDFPESVKASQEVFSLPMHPYLSRDEVRQVAAAIREAKP